MTVFLAWSPEPFPPELDGASDGPWREVRRVAEQVVLVDSEDTLSRVYHELKWSLPGSPALLVTACAGAPKNKGLPPGTTTWLRARAADDEAQ